MANKNKVVLVILDGFGLSPVEQGNAILAAKTPFFDFALKHYSNAALQAAGDAVGLPWGEMGNSEVGHINLGAGRVVLQDYPQISKAIEDGSFFKRPAFSEAVQHVRNYKSRLHLLGIASNGGVHGHIEHLLALIDWAANHGIRDIAVHLIADGRDAPAKSLLTFIGQVEGKLTERKVGRIATICGRYFAMDRDKRWDRTEKAYRLLTEGTGQPTDQAKQAVEDAYARGQSDEFLEPIVVGKPLTISPGDTLIFTNYRPDRAIQLTKVLADPKFDAFKTKPLKNVLVTTMTTYEDTNLPVAVAFDTVDLTDPKTNPLTHPLAQVVAQAKLTQLHIAETEKYAHVTYFFNNGVRTPFDGEEQLLVPSPKVATYDRSPAMSASKITEYFLRKFERAAPSLTVINFANADMVGHTGKLQAAVKAVETLDTLVSSIVSRTIELGSYTIITADHGNAEQMVNVETGEPDKEHTISPVPYILIKPNDPRPDASSRLTRREKSALNARQPVGLLADVAPTILEILGLAKPHEMTGISLLSTV